MSKTVFSSALFEQMGGVNWLTRPGNIEFYPQDVGESESFPRDEQLGKGLTLGFVVEPSANTEINDVNDVQGLDDIKSTAEVSEYQAENPEKSEIILPISQTTINPVTVDSEKNSTVENPSDNRTALSLNKMSNIVVLGAGLNAVWQNDETQAWLLWQNIMLAFNWDESQMAFFDTSHLVSDEMIFTTMEEIIDLGVDWVLTMDDEHPISEQLVEGVHVVSVPDLESMLSDPYAKQSFYRAVVELNNLR